jgi:hypothetical protein
MRSRAKNPLLERRSRSPTGAAWAEDGVGCVTLVSPVLCSSAHRRPTAPEFAGLRCGAEHCLVSHAEALKRAPPSTPLALAPLRGRAGGPQPPHLSSEDVREPIERFQGRRCMRPRNASPSARSARHSRSPRCQSFVPTGPLNIPFRGAAGGSRVSQACAPRARLPEGRKNAGLLWR